MERLSDVNRRLKYLSCPIKETSRLHRNRSGRYETSDGHYYTSGQGIEALIKEGHPEVAYWVWTSVEHDGSDYYLVGHKGVSIDGLTASLGYPQPDQTEVTLAALMAKVIADEPIEPEEGILHQGEGVDLVPANIELSGMEVTLVNTMSRETILREYLKTVKLSRTKPRSGAEYP